MVPAMPRQVAVCWNGPAVIPTPLAFTLTDCVNVSLRSISPDMAYVSASPREWNGPPPDTQLSPGSITPVTVISAVNGSSTAAATDAVITSRRGSGLRGASALQAKARLARLSAEQQRRGFMVSSILVGPILNPRRRLALRCAGRATG